jgi:hypothetical protein
MRCQYCNKKLGFFHLRKTPFCSEEHEERYRAELSGSGVSRLKEMFGPPPEATPQPRPLKAPPPLQPQTVAQTPAQPPQAPAQPPQAPARAALPVPEPPVQPISPQIGAGIAPPPATPPAASSPAPRPPQPAPPPTAGFLVVKSRPLFGPPPTAAGGSTGPLNPAVPRIMRPASGAPVQLNRTEPGPLGKAQLPPVQPKTTYKPAGLPEVTLSPAAMTPELPRSQRVVRPQEPERRPKAPIAPTSPAQTWPRLRPDGGAELVPAANLKAPEKPSAGKIAVPQKPVPERPSQAEIVLTPVQAKPAGTPVPRVPQVELTPELVLPQAVDSERLAAEEAIMQALFPHPAIGQQRPSPAPPPTVLDPFREDFAARRLATMFPIRATTTVVRIGPGEPGPNEPQAFYAPAAAGRVDLGWKPVPVPGNLFSDGPQSRVLPDSALRGPAFRYITRALTLASVEIGAEWTPQPARSFSSIAEDSQVHTLRLRSPIPEFLQAIGLAHSPNQPAGWFVSATSTPVQQIAEAGAIDSTADAVPSALRLRSPIPEHLPAEGLAQLPGLPRGSFADAAPAKKPAYAHSDETPARVPDVHCPIAEHAPESGIAIVGTFSTPPSPTSPQPVRWQVLDPDEPGEDPILPGMLEVSHLTRLSSAWGRLAKPQTPSVRALVQNVSAAPIPTELDPKALDGEALTNSADTGARKPDVQYPAAWAAAENGLGISGTYETAPPPAAPQPSPLAISGLAYTWRAPLLPAVQDPSARPRSASKRSLSCRKHDSPIPPLVLNRVVPAVVEVLGPAMPAVEGRSLMPGPMARISWTLQEHIAALPALPDAIDARIPSFVVPLAESDPLSLSVAVCFGISCNVSGRTLFIADQPLDVPQPPRRRALSNVVCALPPGEPSTRPLAQAAAQTNWEAAAPPKLNRANKTLIRLRPAVRPPAVPTLVPAVFQRGHLGF